MEKRDLIERCREHNVRFVRLQFTELYGQLKNVSIPVEELEKALDNELMFDGSSIRGYKRIEQSDMYFHPDPDTFQLLPWRERESGAVARLICDVADPDGTPFVGDPRVALKRLVKEAKDLGYTMNVGPEAEFFLFKRAADGTPLVDPHDRAGYFDVGPWDLGENTRRDIEDTLVQMGFDLEASHHEVAIGQHEIDFRHADALTCADNLITFRWVVRVIAQQHGMHATFMPKPIFGENGSGMHTHMSLFKDGRNSFFDGDDQWHLSATAKAFIAGQLRHARELSAVFAQWVNSYKRLVPGYEAPVYVAWSQRNRSALIRIPLYKPGSEQATRAEIRCPDPACNPYLTFATLLHAGLEGIEQGYELPQPMETNLYHLTPDERRERGIVALPETLGEAIDELSRSDLMRKALGPHIFDRYVELKRKEWDEYRVQLSQWELDRYLAAL
jgi:glutamine synthetase